MALRIRDGFEFYKNASDPSTIAPGAAYGVYVPFPVGGNAANIVLDDKTPFGVGKSLNWNAFGGVFLETGGFTSQGTLFFGFWMMTTAALGGTTPQSSLEIWDGTTPQCTIRMDGGGNMKLYAGNGFGTILATFTSAIVTPNVWEFYCVKIVIHNTAGEFRVRKNWNTSDDFAATSLVTRQSANNTANGIRIGNNGGGGYYMDEFAHWDGTGSGNWSDWMTAFRGIQLMPNSDSAVQFAQTNGGSTTFGYTDNSSSIGLTPANTIFFASFTPTCGGDFSGSITVELQAALTGHLNIAIYDSDGDNSLFPTSLKQPGALLAQCTALTNPGSGANTFTLASTVKIQNGKKYFIGMWSDATVSMKCASAASQVGWQVTQTYGPPSPSSVAGLGTTNTFRQPAVHGTITINNAGMVNDFLFDGTTTLVSDSTVSDQDLYGIQSLPGSVSTILGVDLVIECNKDVIGTRTISALLKSGATTVTEAAIAVATTMGQARYQQDTDPNTSAAWTPSNVNAMLIGQKIAS